MQSAPKFRDPFLRRDLDIELKQACQAFDLLEYGVELAFFLIELLSRKHMKSLWDALGIVFESMPFEKSRHVLRKKAENLRRYEPELVKGICDRIIMHKFSVHICLFLAEYMEINAEKDMSRSDSWTQYANEYEVKAANQINQIESGMFHTCTRTASCLSLPRIDVDFFIFWLKIICCPFSWIFP